jgi:HD-like signal output (HDOD) protein
VLGFNHAAVGALLVEGWNLPAKLAAVIGHHHQPGAAGRFSLEAAVVHFADILCRALDTGSGGDARMPPLDSAAWQSLELKTEAVETIMDQMVRAFEDISPFATEKIG